MLVIDKPAGIPVHAGPRGGPNLEAGFDALRFGLPHPPALVPVFTHLGLGLALGLFIPPFLVNWYMRAANLIGG